MPLNKDTAPEVFVGLDFGTTWVIFNYLIPIAQTDITTLCDAEFVGEGSETKIRRFPSQVIYGPNGTPRFMSSSDSTPSAIEWFKLSLLHRDDLPYDIKSSSRLRQSEKIRERANKSAVEVTSLFLQYIWKAALKLEDLTDMMHGSLRCHITATVPAVWPSTAIDRFEEAITRAGILCGPSCTLRFLREPEAAALSLLPGIETNDGEVVVIVDCGGGTVDLASYTISQTSPLRLAECTTGRSILAGAVCVEDEFVRRLNKKFEEIPKAYVSPSIFNKLCRKFRTSFFRRLNDLDEQYMSCDIPQLGITLTFTLDELCQIFDHSVQKINSAVEAEVKSIVNNTEGFPHHIIISGGFGRNCYLQNRIKEKVSSISETINVVCYSDSTGELAVARGAVISGQASAKNSSYDRVAKVNSRICRADYGVWYRNQSEPVWMVRKGDALPTVNPIRYNLIPTLFEEAQGLNQDSYYLLLRIFCRRAETDSPHMIDTMKWRVDRQMRPQIHMYLIQLEITHTGTKVEFALLFQGNRQEGVLFSHE
ncbi:hypothetical protein BGZ63DRAFT_464254 [Mariannaea sp. PMI_226]|nr:hypothetical protein BGZ63DRAFT_464254 [Mariannaea sp. PMI_226]